MHERYLGRIQPGMDVCDTKGSRIGSVARIYRYDAGELDTSTGVGGAQVATARDEIPEVETGLLGLRISSSHSARSMRWWETRLPRSEQS